jgi:hypothetical protein
MLATTATAVAQSDAGREAARAEARAIFERAVALMQGEDWETALLEFDRSFALHPSRSALFNRGMCQKALHRYLEAVRSFERWQAEYGDGAPEAEREAVGEALAELRQFLGAIRIVVEPAGAIIAVDGLEVGTAPLAVPVQVGAGRHVVEVTLGGHQPVRREVTVATLERIELAIALEPQAPAVAVAPVEPPDGGTRPDTDPPPDDGSAGPGSIVPPVEGDRPAAAAADGGLDPVWFWTVGGLAVAAGIGGAVAAGLTVGAEDDVLSAKDRCDAGDDAACRDGPGLIATYDDTRWAANGLLFGAAGLAVTAAILAIFTEFGGNETPADLTVTATPTPNRDGGVGGLVLGLAGSF